MSSQSPNPSVASTAAIPGSRPTSSLPRLGPSWAYPAASSGSHKGAFQPPGPQIVGKDVAQTQKHQRTSSGSGGNAKFSGATNSFSLLSGGDDDEETPVDNHRQLKGNDLGNSPSASKEAVTRGSSLRADVSNIGSTKPLFQRSSSSGLRSTGGRSLAELAASAPPSAGRSSSIGVGASMLRRTDSREGGRSFASVSAPVEDPDHPTTRYTREKLLAMRPAPSSMLPAALVPFELIVVVTTSAQDPVSFDEFDADEIWASARGAPRGSIGATPTAGPRGSILATASTGGITEGPGRRSSGGFANGGDGGRWVRGVALPPPGEERRSRSRDYEVEANNPEELWDDPQAPSSGPAADFSSFGVSLDSMSDYKKPDKAGNDAGAFDLSHMSEAALQFEAELHGNVSGDTEAALEPKARPLASLGTTIRSGCGDDVNVFEDPDEIYSESLPATALVPVDNDSTVSEDKTDANETMSPDEPLVEESNETKFNISIGSPVVEISEEEAASSRLMKMIGVEIPGINSSTPSNTGALNLSPGWDAAIGPIAKNVEMSTSPKSAFSIPKNPWGGPVQPVALHDPEWKLMHDVKLQLQQEEEAVAAAARALEEEKQRKMQEEAARHQQAAAAAQQRNQASQQQPSQVEMVLMERVAAILENSWGKADLGSILAALHRDDARVVPLLGSVDALRTLLMRHPARVQVGRDPAFGIDIAVLLQTNAQFLQQQQRQQQQEELERQHRQLLQARQAAAAAAATQRERAVFEQEKRDRDHQMQMRQVVPKVRNAPWFYSDPQGNIQGPFGGDEMRQWLEGGYFKEDLPISQDPNGPFHALSLYFEDWNLAFQPPKELLSHVIQTVANAVSGHNHNQLGRDYIDQREKNIEPDIMQDDEDALDDEEDDEDFELPDQLEKDSECHESEFEDQEKAEFDATSGITLGACMSADQNASSVQLKMLLGLGGSQGKEQATLATRSSSKGTEIASKSQSAKTKQKSPKQPNDLSEKLELQPNTAAPVSVAWGGAAQNTKGSRKKTMSEIQQEEARAAARVARENQTANLGRGNGNGWASVAATGTSAWSNTAVKPSAPSVPSVAGAKPNSNKANNFNGATSSIPSVRSKQQAQVSASKKQVLTQKHRDSNGRGSSAVVENFGATMSPAMESWCKDQLRQITGSDDLTLAHFCMTLNDEAEIKQYLTAYLGTSNQVNSFAGEFISRKNGGRGNKDEWETTGKAKGKKGKKSTGK